MTSKGISPKVITERTKVAVLPESDFVRLRNCIRCTHALDEKTIDIGPPPKYAAQLSFTTKLRRKRCPNCRLKHISRQDGVAYAGALNEAKRAAGIA